MAKKNNNTSPHILNTAANLLGFCLVVIISYHINSSSELSFIDDITSIVALILVGSCICSFYSIKTFKSSRKKYFENIADILFGYSLIGIAVVLIFIVINILH